MPNNNSIPYGLALHTTSSQLGLAISNFIDDTRCSNWTLGRDLSTYLHPYLHEFLAPQNWSDLAFIAVAKGPGSFTSTRIGIVTARTLAQQLTIPLFTISTLAAFAWQQLKAVGEATVALQMPARRDRLFVALYQGTRLGIKPLVPDAVMTAKDWQQVLDTQPLPYRLIDVPEELGESALSVLELAQLEWQQGKRPHFSETVPFYGQHPVDGA